MESPQELSPILTIDDVLRDFKSWRQTRVHREPIPEHLWEAAVSLTKTYPASKVAQILHLNYSKLKQKMTKSMPQSHDTAAPSNRTLEKWPFVELQNPHSRDALAATNSSETMSIEIEKPNGIRFRMSFSRSVPDNVLIFLKSVL